VPIETVLREAQGGQAFANVARAFHLPPEKAGAAVAAMLRELIPLVEKRTQNRRSLAGLVELLGQTGYEPALDAPALIGATHTQVLGSDALKYLAGHAASAKIASDAAAEADVSEMIAEYLLPVLATLVVGALIRATRPGIARIIGAALQSPDPAALASSADRMTADLPRAVSTGAFSGAMGGGITEAPSITLEQYRALAADIKRTDRPLGAHDPMPAVRRALQASLGVGGAGRWLERLQRWRREVLGALFVRRH
jgi:hypothetical protein